MLNDNVTSEFTFDDARFIDTKNAPLKLICRSPCKILKRCARRAAP